MKITILRTNTADFGKIGSYNVQEVGLAKSLINLGHQVSVLYLNKKVNKVTKDSNYDFVFYLPSVSLGLHGIFNTKLLALFEPDKLILFSDNQLWAKNVINWCNKNDTECLQYMGNVLSDNPKWFNQFYTNLILKRNKTSYKKAINIAKTSKVKNEMERYNIRCNGVINVGLDIGLLKENINADKVSFRRELGINTEDLLLLYIGRIIDYKKPFMACDILEEFIDKGINCKLIMIGKGPLEVALHRYIEEKSLSNNIKLLSHVPNDKIYQYMHASDCYINLSSKEIFGMAILESMYYGLPVVAMAAPGPNEIITVNENGYICETEKLNEWTTKILTAIKNRGYISQRSRDTILSKFTWDAIAYKFIDVFER